MDYLWLLPTSNYKSWNLSDYRTYSIFGVQGKMVGYIGRCYPKLAPKLSFWKVWHDNIGVISEKVNNKYYMQEYYNQVLL